MPAETPQTTAIPATSNQRKEPGALCFPGGSTPPKAQGAGLITEACLRLQSTTLGSGFHAVWEYGGVGDGLRIEDG